MKIAIALVLLWGVLVTQCAHADNAQITRPRWVIVVTITDLSTGKQLEQRELGSELEFDDPKECKSIVAEVGPIPPGDHMAVALTCRKVATKEAALCALRTREERASEPRE
jgi:hypothetical protein